VLALKGRLGARGLRVVSVSNYDPDEGEEDKKLIANTAQEEKMTYPCFLDADGAWQKSVGTKGDIPYFLLVDKEGHVVFRHSGKLTIGSSEDKELGAAIEQALDADPKGS